MSPRPGAVSLAELVLVFWLFGFVLLALAAFVSRQNRVAAAQRDLVRFQEARRTATLILGSELRSLQPRDIVPDGSTAIRLRAVRGMGGLCEASGDHLHLRYEGTRWPDPEKDSVLVIGLPGEDVRKVENVTSSAACGPGTVRLALDAPLGVTRGVALVFETGRYDVAQDGLRYRLGQGGRQPLTEAVFAPGRFLVSSIPPGWLLELPLHRDSLVRAPRGLRAFLPMLDPAPDGS